MGTNPRGTTGTFEYLRALGRRVLDLDARKPPPRRRVLTTPSVPSGDTVIDLDAPPAGDATPQQDDRRAELDEAIALAERAAEERDEARRDQMRVLRRVDELVQQRVTMQQDLATATERLTAFESERAEIDHSIGELRAQVTRAEAERDAARFEALTLRARVDQLEIHVTAADIRLGQLEQRFAHRRRFRRGRRLRRIGTTVTLVGIFVGLFGVYETVWTGAATERAQTQLRAAFRQESAAAATVASASPLARPVRRPRTGSLVGRLRIGKIRLDMMVVQGVSRDQLAKGPGVYPQTAPLGARGATAIAGHRTGWGSPFRRLDRIMRGDRIVVQTQTTSFTYRVTRRVVASPDDGWVLAGDPESRAISKLVLTTCTPIWTASHRLIIWADLVAESPRRASRS